MNKLANTLAIPPSLTGSTHHYQMKPDDEEELEIIRDFDRLGFRKVLAGLE